MDMAKPAMSIFSYIEPYLYADGGKGLGAGGYGPPPAGSDSRLSPYQLLTVKLSSAAPPAS